MSNIVRIRPDKPLTPEQQAKTLVEQYEQDIAAAGIDLAELEVEDDDE